MISWHPNPEPELTGYIIYRGSNDNYNESEIIDSVDASTTTYIDSGLNKGQFYFYWLRSKSADGGRSPFSNHVSGMTIPQDASEEMESLCRITEVRYDPGNGSFDVLWTAYAPTIGFVQYSLDMDFELSTEWDEEVGTSHTNSVYDLVTPNTYYMRAVTFYEQNHMIISAIDTVEITGVSPPPVSPPSMTTASISIFPVPFHPGSGGLNIQNLPQNGSVAVYNGNGLEVWSKNLGTETSLVWNGINRSGSRVMSGVYYVITKDSGGEVLDNTPIMIVN
jgi:hypothetical protein